MGELLLGAAAAADEVAGSLEGGSLVADAAAEDVSVPVEPTISVEHRLRNPAADPLDDPVRESEPRQGFFKRWPQGCVRVENFHAVSFEHANPFEVGRNT